MPGFVNYYYSKETDTPPTHTKPAFKSLGLLTIHSLILKNLLVFLFKVKYLSDSPQSTKLLFEGPRDTDRQQNLIVYKNSMFDKGLRLFQEITEERLLANRPLPTDTVNRFKLHLFSHLKELQSAGEEGVWVYENFRLCNQTPTRQSARLATAAE